MSKTKVLIAENSYYMRNTIKSMLYQMNCEVIGEAKTGNDVFDLYRKAKPDLLIINSKLPELNGFEVYETLKSKDFVSQTIFIIDDETSEKDLKKGNIEFYLKKPFTSSELEGLLDKINSKSSKDGEKTEEFVKKTIEEITEETVKFDIIIPETKPQIEDIDIFLSIPSKYKTHRDQLKTPKCSSDFNEKQKVSEKQKTSIEDLSFGYDYFVQLKNTKSNESYCQNERYCNEEELEREEGENKETIDETAEEKMIELIGEIDEVEETEVFDGMADFEIDLSFEKKEFEAKEIDVEETVKDDAEEIDDLEFSL